MKEKLLNEVINFYLGSSSFNGLPIYDIDDYDIEAMVELINEGMVEAISEKDVLNPHIKGFELGLSKKHQIENAKDVDSHTCFYPTDKALEKVKVDYQRPYTALMQNGKAQFDIIFFDVEILERYNNNPRFLIMDNGYRGCISVKDMTLRIDGLYDTIVELEERIEDAKLRRSSIEMEAITLENVYKIMKNFGKLYAIMSDEEKKSVISYLIKEIQIYPNGESEMPLKSIEFNFPIYRDGKEVRKVLWERGNTVETVCLLSRKAQ